MLPARAIFFEVLKKCRNPSCALICEGPYVEPPAETFPVAVPTVLSAAVPPAAVLLDLPAVLLDLLLCC